MPFATDRDLLALEPTVFNDVAFAGQQRLHVTDAELAGTTLSSVLADFAAAQVHAGSVVLLNDLPLEVIDHLNANALSVSRLRTRLTDEPIPPGDTSDAQLIVRTFGPQIQLVHETLRQWLMIEDVSAIVSLSVLGRLEALGALERIYAAGAALDDANVALLQKSHDYRHRFAAAARAATVLLDLDGDGVADTTRRLGVTHMRRG